MRFGGIIIKVFSIFHQPLGSVVEMADNDLKIQGSIPEDCIKLSIFNQKLIRPFNGVLKTNLNYIEAQPSVVEGQPSVVGALRG